MKKTALLCIALQCYCLLLFAQIKIANPLCENRENPIGLDVAQPSFSWQLQSAQRNTMQTAYEIKVAKSITALKKNADMVWSSGKINAEASVHVPYNGNTLQSGEKYYWQVRCWDNKGKVSDWSTPAYWQMGLLQTTGWKAKWIEPGYVENDGQRESPLLRKMFTASKKINSATMFATAHGLYEATINGKRVGDAYLTPGWTSYNKRLQYQVYDVTQLLLQGKNAIGVTLGNGWYRGNLVWNDRNNFFGKTLGLLLQVNITYADGTTEIITSDDTWKSSTGSIVYSEIYHGETIDATKEKTGWNTANYNDNDWSNVKVADYGTSNLVSTINEPVRKHETFKPVKIFTTPKGEQLIDFGQNLVGWVQVRVKGNVGDKIILHHAEILDKAGNFYTENLRRAKQQNIYILKGGQEEFFEPHFTFQGFRYVKVEGYPSALTPENFTAVALYSDMRPAGTFTCSDSLVNQLQHNIQWGQKGNFLDVPTDCPQRDERLGWTGDAQVFSRTASFNMNVNNFFAKWMKDVAADQAANGAITHVVPNVLDPHEAGSTGWADVATIVPWNMYLAYGDKKILAEQYNSMKAWVDFMKNNSTDYLWNKGNHYGDWLYYRTENNFDDRPTVTDKHLIAQCFYAHSTQLIINAATILGKTDDVNNYTRLLANIKEAFIKEYTTLNGRLVSPSQTAYVLALNFDMLPETVRAKVAERLVENIKNYGNHLTTGFLGTPYLCHVLTRFGYTDVAYALLMQKTYPSWLYPVTMGATTIWERWDGQKPDSSFQDAGMNSFNHYAYGAIGDWMYRIAAGIDTYTDEPGYKKIKIMPHVGGGLTNVAANLQTYYGNISSAWKITGNQFQLNVEIPANTTAMIYVPAKDAESITEAGKPLNAVKDISVAESKDGYVVIKAGSGKYEFSTQVK